MATSSATASIRTLLILGIIYNASLPGELGSTLLVLLPLGSRWARSPDGALDQEDPDLMARLAGMRLRERWGGGQREPFTSASPNHISIYELAPA
jgi:hypothetical protein